MSTITGGNVISGGLVIPGGVPRGGASSPAERNVANALARWGGVPMSRRGWRGDAGLSTVGETSRTYLAKVGMVSAGSGIVLLYPNQQRLDPGPTATGEGQTPNALAVKASVQIGSGATVPAPFALDGSLRVASVPTLGLRAARAPTFFWTASQEVYVRSGVTVPSGGQWPLGEGIGGNAGTGSLDGSAAGDAVDGGAVAAGGGNRYGPIGILGIPAPGSLVGSVAHWSDSTGVGVGGNQGSDVQQAILAVLDLAYVQLSNGGEGIADVVASITRREIAKACLSVILGHGLNDSAVPDSVWYAQYIAAMRDFHLAGCQVFPSTITPRLNSAPGGLTTTFDQVVGQYAPLLGRNRWFRAGCPVDPITLQYAAPGTPGAIPCPYVTRVLDRAAAVEDPANPGRFRVFAPVYSGAVTTAVDGTHLVDTGISASGNGVNPWGSYNSYVLKATSGPYAGQVRKIASAYGDNVEHYPFAGTLGVGTTYGVFMVAADIDDLVHLGNAGYDLVEASLSFADFARRQW